MSFDDRGDTATNGLLGMWEKLGVTAQTTIVLGAICLAVGVVVYGTIEMFTHQR